MGGQLRCTRYAKKASASTAVVSSRARGVGVVITWLFSQYYPALFRGKRASGASGVELGAATPMEAPRRDAERVRRDRCSWNEFQARNRLRIVCASSASSPVILLSAQCPECLVFSCPGFGRVLARMLRVLLSHVTDSTGSQQEETILRLGCAAYLQLVVYCRVLWLHPYA